ncbi:MAG TPA: glycoside hydrolase family 15 protein [Planctomycetota bacterium]|nr:glycoside hydrolase family 15 protein [Planctomycetota bacterium]
MADLVRTRPAPGGPGLDPRWTPSRKDGVVTAYSTQSRIWATTAAGIVTEVYYPTIDRPQVRDLQLLVTDGATFFHDERDYLRTEVLEFEAHALGLTVSNVDPEGRYRIVKDLITDPHQPCLLMRARIERSESYTGPLRVFALLAPHLEVGGWGNDGYVASRAGREFLVARKSSTWLAFAEERPFLKRSCGYVGATDGWQEISKRFELATEFDCAENGNIALAAELDLRGRTEVVLGVAFGDHLHHATSTLFQCLGVSFEHHKDRFIDQWHRACKEHSVPAERLSKDGGKLYHRSRSYLIAHEDKTYPGALIASLSIPWGEDKGDEELGGYHLVWTRDLVNSATGLLATGDTWTPLRALIYLACLQRGDGGFPQNSWIDGDPYWTGVQLDEVAFPILLAHRLHEAGALREFDPYPLVLAAAGYLVRSGPVTHQERWEEASGYSPSTLAAVIAALVCAAVFARARDDEETASFLEEHADFLESRVEQWTVTHRGTLVPEIPRHYIRILPADPGDPSPPERPDGVTLHLKNKGPGERSEFAAKEIVDAGFLELVRYGIRKGGDPLVEDSLAVIDRVLKVETPYGPCWRRYNEDGYGERQDGSPFRGWGKGRAWPLLTGERAHYELAAGRDARALLHTLEDFAHLGRLIPEQVWDEPDLPERGLQFGRATGGAMPLMWAHAEYVKLVRSLADGRVFDRVPAVFDRYVTRPKRRRPLEVWKFNRQVRSMRAGETLRIIAPAPFTLRWAKGDWSGARNTPCRRTAARAWYVDVETKSGERAPVRFTFGWEDGRWEGRDFEVALESG